MATTSNELVDFLDQDELEARKVEALVIRDIKDYQ
jgi:hypothetical protein